LTTSLQQSFARRFRRAHALVGCWEDNHFSLRNYLSGRRVRVDPILTHILHKFSDYTRLEKALQLLSDIPGPENLLTLLVQQDILLEEGSPIDDRDRAVQKTWRWGHEARFFHFGTRDVPYEQAIQRESLLRLMREEPPLGPFHEVSGERIALAGGFSGLDGTLGEALLSRRTRRHFSHRELSFDLFGRVMGWTWGSTHFMESGEIGPYVLKTSPSGGARHSIEAYPLVMRVEGLRPGVYHYAVRDHALVLKSPDLTSDALSAIFVGQPWLVEAPVVCVMVSRIARSDWKYRHGHAYRVLLLDAGHLGQTFHLVCASLGLAPFTLSGFNDSLLERTLGLDGVGEIALYAAACGYPSEGPNDFHRQ
jgi:SagB-type dehydrogenase family enzyme